MGNFKVRYLKVYVLDEWLANKEKKYRQVFAENGAS